MRSFKSLVRAFARFILISLPVLAGALSLLTFATPASAAFCNDTISTEWSTDNLGQPAQANGSFVACQDSDDFSFNYASGGVVTFNVSADTDNKLHISLSTTGTQYPDFTLTLTDIDFAVSEIAIISASEASPQFEIVSFSGNSITIQSTYGANNSVLWDPYPSWQQVQLVEGTVNPGFCEDTIDTTWSSTNIYNPVQASGSFVACSTSDTFSFNYASGGVVTFEVSADVNNKLGLSVSNTGPGYPDFELTLSGIDFADLDIGVIDALTTSPQFDVVSFTPDSITIQSTYGLSNNVSWDPYPNWRLIQVTEGQFTPEFCGDTINTSWSSTNLYMPVQASGSFVACQTSDAFTFEYGSVAGGTVTFDVSAIENNKFDVSVSHVNGYPDFTLTLSDIDFNVSRIVVNDALESSPQFQIVAVTQDSITIQSNYGLSNNISWDPYPDWRQVQVIGGSSNLPPTANAGPDQAIHAGDSVQLDGSASFDDNTPSVNLTYAWTLTTQPSGSAATLTGATTATPGFVADMSGSYLAQLIVTDEGALSSSADTVDISSSNLAPQAAAGIDQLVVVGDFVSLNGSDSSDPDGDTLSYDWSMASAPAGSTSSLNGINSATPDFIPDTEGTYSITLVVSDFIGPGAPDSVDVVATTAGGFAEVQIVAVDDAVATLDPALGEVTTAGNQNAYTNFLTQAMVAIQDGDIAAAIDKLEKAIVRADGCALRGEPDGTGRGRDWITDCDVQIDVYNSLTDALNALTAP
jgi:hypothetical protein